MKVSVEAKVAASIAAGFVALTVGVIAQENSEEGPNGYGPTNNVKLSTRVNQHGYDGSLADRANAEDNRHRTQWQRRESL